MTAFLSIALLLAVAQILRERRAARRNYGRLLCDHKAELARHGMRRFAEGLNLAKERARMGRDWQEAARP